MEASDMNVDKNKQSIMQHHGIPVQVEPEDEIELSGSYTLLRKSIYFRESNIN